MQAITQKNRYKTLTFKLTFGSQLIIVPLVFFLIFNNYYSIKILRDKVSESKADMVALYMNEIDSELRNVDDFLLRVITYDMSVSNLDNEDQGERVIAQVNLKDSMVQANATYDLVDGFFVYHRATKDYIHHITPGVNIKKESPFTNILRTSWTMTETSAALSGFRRKSIRPIIS